METAGVLDEVGAEEERILVGHGGDHVREELGARRRRQVADGAAEERDQAPSAGGEQVEVVLEVADDGVDVEARVLGDDGAGCASKGRLADVEGNEPAQHAAVSQRGQEQARLLRRARSELDERVGAGGVGDGAGAGIEDLALAPGRVVLREAGDLVEELAAALVVEPLGGQLFRGGREPGARVALERRPQVVAAEVDVEVNGQSPFTSIPAAVTETTAASGTQRQPVPPSNGSDAMIVAPRRSSV